MPDTPQTSHVKSMTAFARHRHPFALGHISWEVRSVNHRYLETQVKIPDTFRFLEMEIRDRVKAQLHRGKVDVFLSVQFNQHANEYEINQAVLGPLSHAICTVQQTLMEATQVNPLDILKWPGIIATDNHSENLEKQQTALLHGLNQTLEKLNAHRLREGEALAQLVEQRCEAIQNQVEQLTPKLPEMLEHQIDKLKHRIATLTEQLDEDRLLQEVAILAQKADVEEELDRVLTHLTEVRHVLESDQPIGRRLDFLMQELNREANTLGSKAIHADISKASVELKVLIEQMREQVQNIE